MPFYLTWYFIIPIWFFWPGWYPVGLALSTGLWLVRMRSLPASRGRTGRLVTLCGSLLAFAFACKVYQDSKLPGDNYTDQACLILTSLFTLWGLILIYQSRGATKLVALIHKKQLRSVEAVSKALGRKEAAVSADIQRLRRNGWLDGYEFDVPSGHIRYSGIPAGFFDIIRRTKIGAGFLCLGVILLAAFWRYAPEDAIGDQIDEVKTFVADQREQWFPTDVLACAAMPKEDLGRILGTKFVGVRNEHVKGLSRCGYLSEQRTVDGKKDSWVTYQIVLYPAGETLGAEVTREAGQVKIHNAGDAAASLFTAWLGSAIDTQQATTERALALQRKLGDGYRVFDEGYYGVKVERGGRGVEMQTSASPLISVFGDLVHAPNNHTAEPTVEEFAEIARETLARALR